jgi:hypothetical protein
MNKVAQHNVEALASAPKGAMTVAQLIKALQRYDEDAPVHASIPVPEPTWAEVVEASQFKPHDPTHCLLRLGSVIME